MPLDNNAKTEFVIADINAKIKQQNDIIGFNTTSSLESRLKYVDETVAAFDPAIKGIDNKIVSIGQSINQLKDEIIVLISDAVGVSTVNTCGIASTDPITGDCFVSGDGGLDGGWAGGISTCLVGYTPEYYDTITSRIWAFSSTSSNPFVSSTAILSSASNTFGAGIGTFLVVNQNNSSYTAGYRVTLKSTPSCASVQAQIDAKDAEIATLRTEIGKYLGVVNTIREQRWKSQLEKWGITRAQKEAQEDKDKLVGVLTAFTDSTYTSLFLK